MTGPLSELSCGLANTPHWQTNETTHEVISWPVLYVSGSSVQADVTFTNQAVRANGMSGNLPLFIRGEVSGGNATAPFKLLGTNLTSVGGTCLVDTYADHPLTTNTVDIFRPMTIQWYISCTNKPEYFHAGTSTNQVYVSWQAPTTANLYHTVVDVACRNATGQSVESNIVNKVWSVFTNRSMLKADWTGPMRYWGPTGAGHVTTAELAAIGDGQCGAWANFTVDAFRIHGTPAVLSAITPLLTIGPPPPPPFSAVGQANGFEVRPEMEGQGVPRPNNHFFDHAVVKIAALFPSTIFDPSYGSRIDGSDMTDAETIWDDTSVTNFATIYFDALGNQAPVTTNNPTGKQVSFNP